MSGLGGAGRGDWRRTRARPPQSAVTVDMDMEINPGRIGMERRVAGLASPARAAAAEDPALEPRKENRELRERDVTV